MLKLQKEGFGGMVQQMQQLNSFSRYGRILDRNSVAMLDNSPSHSPAKQAHPEKNLLQAKKEANGRNTKKQLKPLSQ